MKTLTVVERDALRRSLMQLRDIAEQRAKAGAAQVDGKADAESRQKIGEQVDQEYEDALAAVLLRALPESSPAHEMAKEEPLRAINRALAYLDLVPPEWSPEREQVDFDGHFASLVTRSKPLRFAVGLFFVVILGGTTYLGFETAGALRNIGDRQNQALEAIGQGEARTLDAIERVKKEVSAAGTAALTKVDGAVAASEETLERKITKAAEEVVGARGGEARRTIEAEKDRALRELEALSGPAAQAIAEARDSHVKNLGIAATRAQLTIEQKLNELLPIVSTDLENLRSRIDEEAKSVQKIQERLDEADRISEAVERLKADDGVLASVAALLGVARWVLVFILVTVVFAFGLSVMSLLTQPGRRVRKVVAAIGLLVVVGLALLIGWKAAATSLERDGASLPAVDDSASY